MLTINYTGRVLSWFVKDIHACLARGAKPVVLPFSDRPPRNAGLWFETPALQERPLLWSFPQPLHPIEAIASLRGFGGFVGNREDPAFWGERMKNIAVARSLKWVEYTNFLSRFLFVSPETVRLVWHLLTPGNVPAKVWHLDLGLSLWTAETQLWSAATGDMRPPLIGVQQAAYRPDFWTKDVTGEIEL